jgi:hypothetical protein
MTSAFPIQTPRFKVQHLIDWLAPQLYSDAVLVPGRLPTMPHRAVGLILQPGRGFDQDNNIDQPAILFQSRGGIDNFSDAEDIAYEIDSIFMTVPSEFDIADNIYVESIQRQGGAPSAMPLTDAQNRWVFNCAYIVRTFTNLS